MNFGQKVLEKYGWKKGDGLGKKKDGMKEAIKPKLKANNLGFGFKLGAEFQDNWWENVYNEAASNISVEKNDTTCFVKTIEEDVELLPHKKKKCCKSIKESHSLFQKESTVSEENNVDRLNVFDNSMELFEKCGKRTVHKGARHGLSLSGKLSRLEKQEEVLLQSLKQKKPKKRKAKS